MPYAELTGQPHVVVDGSAQSGTMLTLSHWPGSPTADILRDDLSAQIAFHALDHPGLLEGLEHVTNNHFDQDGIVSVFALTEPDAASARLEQLIDVARAGDFSWFRRRTSARAAITLAELANATEGDPYEALLPRLVEIVENPDRFRVHWEAEDAHISETERAIARGTITIEEVADVDLAIVTIPSDWAQRTVHRFTTTDSGAAHPYAIHNATRCFRVLTVGVSVPELRFRYETWVHLVSRRPVPRVDLAPLAAVLTEEEPGDVRWVFDPIDSLSPALHLLGAAATAIEPARLRECVVTELRAAQVTWSPYT